MRLTTIWSYQRRQRLPTLPRTAGWAVLVKEAVANGRPTPAGGPLAPVTAVATDLGVTEDAIACLPHLLTGPASAVYVS